MLRFATFQTLTKQFYHEKLGFDVVLEGEELCLLNADGTLLGIRGGASETSANDRFDPFRVGLDHLALDVDAASLESLKQQLDAAGVRNNGIETDDALGTQYISFYDPDGIAWELYARPSR